MKWDPQINLETLITLVYCLLTAFILIIAFRQFRSFNNTNNAQFFHNLDTKVFTEEGFKLIVIIEAGCLEFNANKNKPIFTVNKNIMSGIYPNRAWKDYYISLEVDYLLLNPLNIVASHANKRVIDTDTAFHYFGWYVNVILKSNAIIDYFNWIDNVEKNGYVFEHLSSLYKKFKPFYNHYSNVVHK